MAAWALWSPLRASALEYVPMYSASILGGQFILGSRRTGLEGNVSARVAPAIKTGGAWTLLPMYAGDYLGTKPATDPVGSNRLFSRRMDHRVSLTGVYAADSGSRLRPSLHYKREFLKETADESWGKGLFDSETAGASVELERGAWRLGYELYRVRFPNYGSIGSKSGIDPAGDPLHAELSGARALDNLSHQFSAAAAFPFPYAGPDALLQAGYRLSWRSYPGQPVIDDGGQAVSRHRRDIRNSVSLTIAAPGAVGGGIRASAGLRAEAAYDASNQNSFDPERSVFDKDAYSSVIVAGGPSVGLSWGNARRPTKAALDLAFSRRAYRGRRAQDAAGAYVDDKLRQDRVLLALEYGFPIARDLRLLTRASLVWASSNSKYEKGCKYTYNAAAYLVGFTYDY